MSDSTWGPPEPPDLPQEGRLYQHWKGDFYRIVTTALWEPSKPENEWVVVYFSLRKKYRSCRKLSVFQELVEWPDGTMQPRFKPAVNTPTAA